MDAAALEQTVQQILDDVKTNGDAAVKNYTRQFDGVEMEDMLVDETANSGSCRKIVPDELKYAIELAAANITTIP